ncbi:MAG: hypothetical protein H6730_34030 [Deltaproteobacteria bacterium]|nr:hypothetical protein [Deltaproteobacteria bacterium]
MRTIQRALLITSIGLFACTGSEGPAGPTGATGPAGPAGATGTNGTDGTDGTGCTVTDNNDGTYTVDCNGEVVTLNDGTPGAGCTIVDNGDSTYTVTCGDTTTTIRDGADVDPTTLEDILAKLDEASNVEPESCAICHSNSSEVHQGVYNQYADQTELAMVITSVVSTPNPACTAGTGCYDGTCDTGNVCQGEWAATMTFTITKNGLPYLDVAGLPQLEQKTFLTAHWDGTQFDAGGLYFGDVTPTATPGVYTAVAAPGAQRRALPWDPAGTDAFVYAYIADNLLDTESGGHVSMYDDVASASFTNNVNGIADFTSSVNVSGCEKCHGAPYMKHGYRDPVVAGLGDFVSCKACHWDTRTGSHVDWQILVDDPLRYAEIHEGSAVTTEERTMYAYKATIMNDTHMSHAMEFPYPQSMANCTTCHEGKLSMIQVDANFTRATCRSCHALTGDATYGTAAKSMQGIWTAAGVGGIHQISWFTDSNAMECNLACHTTGGAATTKMADLHNGGFDPKVYSQGGAAKYPEVFVTQLDSATWDSTANTLNVTFSSTEVGGAATVPNIDVSDIVPSIEIALYGFDTKDFIVDPHGRDSSNNRLLEFTVDGVATHPRFTVNSAAAGAWDVTADLSMWADMFADGTIRRAEISILPALTQVVGEADVNVGTCSPACARGSYCNSADTCVVADDVILATVAPSRTFDFTANAFDDAFYDDLVDVQKCNDCHESLATTFHSPNRGGNLRVCRSCHNTLSGGSHLELQSRSIDSYVHAIHSFQPFDIGDIDFTDPVEKTRYDLHIEHVFPNFTAKNCESCHLPGKYNVPDQSKSLPGKLSGSDTVAGRSLSISAVDTGPGARACGACHRARMLNEGQTGKIVSFYQHTKDNGYLVEDATGVLDTIIAKIMSFF